MADLDSTVLYDSLYPKINEALNNTANVRKVQEFFSDVMSQPSNYEALAMQVPYKSLFVHRKSELKYYEAINLSEECIADAVARSPHIPAEGWDTAKKPMYISLLLVAICFRDKKNMKMFEAIMFLWSLYMYKSAKAKYFKYNKTGESSLRCMEFTINRLSYKNDLKKYKNIEETIKKKTEVYISNWFENRNELNGKLTDDIICRMINDNRRRYEMLIQNFYGEFKKDLLAGNYLNVDQDIDNEDEYMESDNVSFMVEKNTQKVMNKFILSTYPNGKIIEQVCTREPGCSVNNLRNMLNYIYDDHEREFEKLVRVIIQIYLFEHKKKVEDLKSFDFERTMMKHYKGQSIDDKNLIELKRLIENIVSESGLYNKVTRQATRNDCKRALMLYVVVYIRYALIG